MAPQVKTVSEAAAALSFIGGMITKPKRSSPSSASSDKWQKRAFLSFFSLFLMNRLSGTMFSGAYMRLDSSNKETVKTLSSVCVCGEHSNTSGKVH